MLVKKYFTRPKDPQGIKLQERDYHLLALLDDYRFLDTLMLWQLARRKYPALSYDVVKHRLYSLWTNGYIQRPIQQVAWMVESNDFHLISCLSEKGAEAVALRLGRDFHQTTWRVDQERANFRLLAHQLAISRFRAAVELCGAFQILFWFHDRQFKRRVGFQIETQFQRQLLQAEYVGERVFQMIQPDSFFLLQSERKIQAYALEIDMGTVSAPAMARKYLIYQQFLRGLRESPMVIEKRPISHFLVLTVCPDESPYEEKRKGVRIRQLQFAVRELDEKKRGYRAFWFTTADRFNWRQAQSLLKSIWQTPIPGEMLSLLD